ncbi:hypothetical protein [Amycolatopsis solani]|uniref:hypothetical protein n=1 Tax=Amycolatopsis solani TaxID=3028615 RepID=UPI00296EC4C3|nr:hypothetical protein [Amycolatopsis sp. MEP2-6]
MVREQHRGTQPDDSLGLVPAAAGLLLPDLAGRWRAWGGPAPGLAGRARGWPGAVAAIALVQLEAGYLVPGGRAWGARPGGVRG